MTHQSTDRVALAFSGGLDTTVCVPLLEEEYGYDEVIGVTVDVGQPEEELAEAEETAEALDLDHYVVDAKDAFAEQCLDAVKANATYQSYPLGTALARIRGHIEHVDLDRISPLAVPVMLEIGKEPVYGEGHESILEDISSEDLIAEAMRLD